MRATLELLSACFLTKPCLICLRFCMEASFPSDWVGSATQPNLLNPTAHALVLPLLLKSNRVTSHAPGTWLGRTLIAYHDLSSEPDDDMGDTGQIILVHKLPCRDRCSSPDSADCRHRDLKRLANLHIIGRVYCNDLRRRPNAPVCIGVQWNHVQ